MKPRILVVDDEPYTVTIIEELLRDHDLTLVVARDCAEARRRFREADFSLVLMDRRLPDGNGLDLLEEMRRERPRQVAIMVTAYADVRDAMRAVRGGLFDYLTKPFENLEEVETLIGRALELDGAYREIDALRERLDGRKGPVLIGGSRAMENLLAQVRQVAPLDTTVLLEAESGTGKEIIARTVHALGPFASGRFMELNCGALPEQLQESTLFGYEKGAFTGAARSTPGCLEEADGGTLFLDEVADMSPGLQSSLLRVLQERTFTRLGSTQLRETRFRLVCATNRRLADEVRAGRFREDLFYRLNVVSLEIPPLRERQDDVLPLATFFLEHFNEKFGKRVGPLTPEAMSVLERQGWPGNVRQLRNALERLVALRPDGIVGASDLQQSTRLEASGPAGASHLRSYEEERGFFEREYFRRLMETAGGNVSEAARLSGFSRQTLYERMKRWGVVPAS